MKKRLARYINIKNHATARAHHIRREQSEHL